MFFNYLGNEEENNDFICAKIENNSYFVKVATGGVLEGFLFDPTSPLLSLSDLNKVNTRKGKKLYEFQKVDKPTFDCYLMFLKSKRKKYLDEAERRRRCL
ncbi:MAG: hypothetical protein SNJ64_05695 [Endomicrobiia bacterium]